MIPDHNLSRKFRRDVSTLVLSKIPSITCTCNFNFENEEVFLKNLLIGVEILALNKPFCITTLKFRSTM